MATLSKAEKAARAAAALEAKKAQAIEDARAEGGTEEEIEERVQEIISLYAAATKRTKKTKIVGGIDCTGWSKPKYKAWMRLFSELKGTVIKERTIDPLPFGKLDQSGTWTLERTDPTDPLSMMITFWPNEGYYNNTEIHISVMIPEGYPFKAPQFTCVTKVYSPTIMINGKICQDAINDRMAEGQGWNPAMDLAAAIVSVLSNFYDFTSDGNDALCPEIGQVLHSDKAKFKANVLKAVQGGTIDGKTYDNCSFTGGTKVGYKGEGAGGGGAAG